MDKKRLDQVLVARGLVTTRSQAESWIRLGRVFVAGRPVTKPGFLVPDDATVVLKADEQYVSRAGLKLASVAQLLKLNFSDAVVLDVGSSTGGFTDYALQHGARKVIAVDVGTNQLHPSLQGNPKIELHEQTDIRSVLISATQNRTGVPQGTPHHFDRAATKSVVISEVPDVVVIDVSFISLREILPHVARLVDSHTKLAAMLKPQFEAGHNAKHKGIIKNDAKRRAILKDFELWVKKYFVIVDKADSQVAGTKGNRERFYLLQKMLKG